MAVFDMEKFIACIREHPTLWQKNRSDFRDKTKRDMCWTEIGIVIVSNWHKLELIEQEHKINVMKGKWRHLRDSFLKYLNKNTVSDPKKKKYIYSDALDFLLPFITNKRRNRAEKEDKDGDVQSPSTSHSQTVQKSKRQSTMKTPKTVKSKLLNKVNKEVNSRQQEEDADKSFMLSLLPDYKSLNDDDKLDFRLMSLEFIRNCRQKRKHQIMPPATPQTQVLCLNPHQYPTQTQKMPREQVKNDPELQINDEFKEEYESIA